MASVFFSKRPNSSEGFFHSGLDKEHRRKKKGAFSAMFHAGWPCLHVGYPNPSLPFPASFNIPYRGVGSYISLAYVLESFL